MSAIDSLTNVCVSVVTCGLTYTGSICQQTKLEIYAQVKFYVVNLSV